MISMVSPCIGMVVRSGSNGGAPVEQELRQVLRGGLHPHAQEGGGQSPAGPDAGAEHPHGIAGLQRHVVPPRHQRLHADIRAG